MRHSFEDCIRKALKTRGVKKEVCIRIELREIRSCHGTGEVDKISDALLFDQLREQTEGVLGRWTCEDQLSTSGS